MPIKTIHYRERYCLSYTEYGNPGGFPVLIQHGLIASITDSDLFDGLIRAGRRLICMARPGYGESSPYEMKSFGEWGQIAGALIDELELSRFDVLGMSSGAPYSYAIGCRFPEKTRNIYIFSGIPALYDEKVLACWPYAVKKGASLTEMADLARKLFFSNLSPEDLQKDDIRDSMMNNCFGPAQDFRLRGLDWGFRLDDVKQAVFMEHSKDDPNVPFVTAELTSQIIPNCQFKIRESGGHFSKETLDDFIRTVMLATG